MEHEIQILVDYVEGKFDICSFREEFLNNSKLKYLLSKKIDMPCYKYYNYNIYECFYGQINPKKNNWNNIFARYIVWFDLRQFLSYNGIKFNDYCKYANDYNFLLDIQPSWLDISDDQGLFDKVISEIPNSLSKTKRIQLGKAKIKELFRYDKTYPRWVQDPEWPIIDGVPLVFSHQSKEKKDDERVYYYFYHPKTKKQVVVEQIY